MGFKHGNKKKTLLKLHPNRAYKKIFKYAHASLFLSGYVIRPSDYKAIWFLSPFDIIQGSQSHADKPFAYRYYVFICG